MYNDEYDYMEASTSGDFSPGAGAYTGASTTRGGYGGTTSSRRGGSQYSRDYEMERSSRARRSSDRSHGSGGGMGMGGGLDAGGGVYGDSYGAGGGGMSGGGMSGMGMPAPGAYGLDDGMGGGGGDPYNFDIDISGKKDKKAKKKKEKKEKKKSLDERIKERQQARLAQVREERAAKERADRVAAGLPPEPPAATATSAATSATPSLSVTGSAASLGRDLAPGTPLTYSTDQTESPTGVGLAHSTPGSPTPATNSPGVLHASDSFHLSEDDFVPGKHAEKLMEARRSQRGDEAAAGGTRASAAFRTSALSSISAGSDNDGAGSATGAGGGHVAGTGAGVGTGRGVRDSAGDVAAAAAAELAALTGDADMRPGGRGRNGAGSGTTGAGDGAGGGDGDGEDAAVSEFAAYKAMLEKDISMSSDGSGSHKDDGGGSDNYDDDFEADEDGAGGGSNAGKPEEDGAAVERAAAEARRRLGGDDPATSGGATQVGAAESSTEDALAAAKALEELQDREAAEARAAAQRREKELDEQRDTERRRNEALAAKREREKRRDEEEARARERDEARARAEAAEAELATMRERQRQDQERRDADEAAAATTQQRQQNALASTQGSLGGASATSAADSETTGVPAGLAKLYGDGGVALTYSTSSEAEEAEKRAFLAEMQRRDGGRAAGLGDTVDSLPPRPPSAASGAAAGVQGGTSAPTTPVGAGLTSSQRSMDTASTSSPPPPPPATPPAVASVAGPHDAAAIAAAGLRTSQEAQSYGTATLPAGLHGISAVPAPQVQPVMGPGGVPMYAQMPVQMQPPQPVRYSLAADGTLVPAPPDLPPYPSVGAPATTVSPQRFAGYPTAGMPVAPPVAHAGDAQAAIAAASQSAERAAIALSAALQAANRSGPASRDGGNEYGVAGDSTDDATHEAAPARSSKASKGSRNKRGAKAGASKDRSRSRSRSRAGSVASGGSRSRSRSREPSSAAATRSSRNSAGSRRQQAAAPPRHSADGGVAMRGRKAGRGATSGRGKPRKAGTGRGGAASSSRGAAVRASPARRELEEGLDEPVDFEVDPVDSAGSTDSGNDDGSGGGGQGGGDSGAKRRTADDDGEHSDASDEPPPPPPHGSRTRHSPRERRRGSPSSSPRAAAAKSRSRSPSPRRDSEEASKLRQRIREIEDENSALQLELQRARADVVTAEREADAAKKDAAVAKAAASEQTGSHALLEAIASLRTAGLDDGSVDAAALERVRSEMATLENIIRGYQTDNERLTVELKDANRKEAEASAALARENARMSIEVNDLRNRASVEGGPARGATLRKELDADAQVRAATEALEAERSRARTIESELKFELDKVRQAKKDLECRVAGVDMDTVRAENEELERVKRQLKIARGDHEAEVGALQRRLKWYAENQAMIDKDEATVAQQAAHIRQLEARIEAMNAEGGGGANGDGGGDAAKGKGGQGGKGKGGKAKGRSTAADARRIKELETQLREAEETLAKRHPDSISNMIRAAKPSAEEGARVKELGAKVSELEKAAGEREADHEKRLRALRQEHEKVRLQYEKQAAALQTQVDESKSRSTREGTDLTQANNALKSRVAELEKEVKHTREFYTQKLKDAGSRGGNGGAGAFGGAADVDTAVDRARAAMAADHKAEVASLVDEISMLRSMVDSQHATGSASSGGPSTPTRPKNGGVAKGKRTSSARKGSASASAAKAHSPAYVASLVEEIATLRAQLKGNGKGGGKRRSRSSGGGSGSDSEDSDALRARLDERDATVKQLVAALSLVGGNGGTSGGGSGSAAAAASGAAASSGGPKVAWADEGATRAGDAGGGSGDAASSSSAASGPAATALAAATAAFEHRMAEQRRALANAAADNERLRVQVDRMVSEVDAARREAELPKTPSMARFQSLSAVIMDLERRLEMRETELSRAQGELRAASDLELQVAKRQFEAALHAKDLEIQRFRAELDGVMSVLEQVYDAGVSLPPGPGAVAGGSYVPVP